MLLASFGTLAAIKLNRQIGPHFVCHQSISKHALAIFTHIIVLFMMQSCVVLFRSNFKEFLQLVARFL